MLIVPPFFKEQLKVSTFTSSIIVDCNYIGREEVI
jgi:hypothetical protein